MCTVFIIKQIIIYTLRHHNQTIQFEYNILILHKVDISALKYDDTMDTFWIPYMDVFVYMDLKKYKVCANGYYSKSVTHHNIMLMKCSLTGTLNGYVMMENLWIRYDRKCYDLKHHFLHMNKTYKCDCCFSCFYLWTLVKRRHISISRARVFVYILSGG